MDDKSRLDAHYMSIALGLAKKAAEEGEVPVGAVVVCHESVIGEGYNKREQEQDPLAHAEIVAIREAAQRLGCWRLEECTLYVTLEPCPMCLGAMINARVPRLVFGAYDPKAGACGSVLDFASHPRLNHRLNVNGGVLAAECGEQLTSFFRRMREQRKSEDPR